MSGQQFATILARTDPFDVAQGLERYIRTLTGEELRALIGAAAPRMNDWYRTEFLPLAVEQDTERLRRAFAHSLKSSLRAIPLFGPDFCEGVISKIPGDRTVGLGEDGNPNLRVRPVVYAIIALALLIGGAAAEHVVSTARANANTPVVLVTPEPPVAAPSPTAAPAPVIAHRAAPRVAPPQHTAAPPPVPKPAPAAVPVRPPVHARAPLRRTPPPGRGAETVVQVPRRDPTAQATPVDVSDMPQAYSDATPLPVNATPPAAQVNTAVSVPTPTPGANRYWLHSTINGVGKTIDRLNPFKHHSGPDPTASPNGPQ